MLNARGEEVKYTPYGTPYLPVEYVPIGRAYMFYARRQPRWDAFVQALLEVNLRQTVGSPEEDITSFKRVVLQRYPTPDSVDCSRLILPPLPWYNIDTAELAVCYAVRHWPEVQARMNGCNPRFFYGENKIPGFRYKGADMLMLDAGCMDIGIADRWIIRAFSRRDLSQQEIARIQSGLEYFKYRQMEINAAYRVGLPPSVYHVALWFYLSVGSVDESSKIVSRLFGL